MKLHFLRMMFSALVETSAPQAIELTSEKLTELKRQYTEQWQKMLTMSDPFSEETKNAKLALWKIEGEIKAEQAALQKAANDAKLAEMMNKRLELNANQLQAHAELLAVTNNKKSTPEEIQTATDKFNAAKEIVDNELLAKFAASKPAKVSSDKVAGEKSGNANTAAIIELYLAGKTHKEIEEAGYKRSTVWHAINNYKKANQA